MQIIEDVTPAVNNPLARLDNATQALAEATTLAEVKKIKAVADLARGLMHAARMCRVEQNRAAEISLMAIYKAGQILGNLTRSPGQRTDLQPPARLAGGSEYNRVLGETHTSQRTARYWQQIADIPVGLRDAYIISVKQSPNGEITAAGLLRTVQSSISDAAVEKWKRERAVIGVERWERWRDEDDPTDTGEQRLARERAKVAPPGCWEEEPVDQPESVTHADTLRIIIHFVTPEDKEEFLELAGRENAPDATIHVGFEMPGEQMAALAELVRRHDLRPTGKKMNVHFANRAHRETFAKRTGLPLNINTRHCRASDIKFPTTTDSVNL